MSFKKVTLTAISGILIGISSVFAFSFFTNSNNSAQADDSAQAETNNTLKVASTGLVERSSFNTSSNILGEVSFSEKIKLPTELPISVDKVFDEVIEIDDEGNKSTATHYINEETKSAIVVSVTDVERIPSDEGITKIQSAVGEVQYFDNGIYQFIYFNKDSLFYEIQAKKSFDDDNLKFTEEELLSIVEGL